MIAAFPPPRIIVNVFVTVYGALPGTVTVALYVPVIVPLVAAERSRLRPRGPRTLVKVKDIVRLITLPERAVTFIVSIPDHTYEPLIVTVSVFVFEAVQLPLKETR